MIIPDAGGVVLEDGEILQLPPTPSMMESGEAGESGSGGEKSGAGGLAPVPGPAPTPPRLPSRPVLPKRESSASNYGTPPEVTPVAHPSSDPFTDARAAPSSNATLPLSHSLPPPAHSGDLPPSYSDETPAYAAPYAAAAGASGYPDEKAELKRRDQLEAEQAALASQGSGADHAGQGASGAGEEMSESEKREWAEAEEMIRLEKEEMERLQRSSLAGTPGSAGGDHGVQAGGISEGVKGMSLGSHPSGV